MADRGAGKFEDVTASQFAACFDISEIQISVVFYVIGCVVSSED